MFFRIIVPNYNNSEWIEKCINSILNQTFQDFKIIIVDDASTDNSKEVIEKLKNDKIIFIPSEKKLWNGGTRNRGLQEPIESKYTLFIDSDDWYKDSNCLQLIHDTIVENNYPDCVSLSYNCLIGEAESYQSLVRNTPQDLVGSLFVACWTKCIKSELIVPFPENTLMEDVVQHIAQVDKLETIVSIDKPIVVWNRNNLGSCSRVENQNCQKGKWQSSMFRYMADLLDLEVKHDYCEAHRQWRIEITLNNIKEGKYIQ